jgi:hypothetical protein
MCTSLAVTLNKMMSRDRHFKLEDKRGTLSLEEPNWFISTIGIYEKTEDSEEEMDRIMVFGGQAGRS